MKLYYCPAPHAVVVARDEIHAHVLLHLRLTECCSRRRTFDLVELDTRHARVIHPPPKGAIRDGT